MEDIKRRLEEMQERLDRLESIAKHYEHLDMLASKLSERLDEVEIVPMYDLMTGPDFDPSVVPNPPSKDQIKYARKSDK